MVTPSGVLHRIGWKGSLWTPRPAGNGRFDDPRGHFSVVYASSQLFGCFVETLACYRKDDVLAMELAEIVGPDDHVPLGEVPREWLVTRAVGEASVQGDFLDICHSQWLSDLAAVPEFRGVDASDLQSPRRALTQAISVHIHRTQVLCRGLRYPSRFGHDIENWAIYQRVPVSGSEVAITATNPDLFLALNLLRLALAPPSESPATGRT